MAGEAKEFCAVTAELKVGSGEPAAVDTYKILNILQHRGEEATGIATLEEDGVLHSRSDQGFVKDVFKQKHINKLVGNMAVGGNRYSTSGSKDGQSQLYTDRAIGFAFAENGNIPDTTQIEGHLDRHHIKTKGRNDAEMVGLTLAQEIREKSDLPSAVSQSYELFTGAFSCVAMHDETVVGFRDPMGLRPLELGILEDGGYVLASETCGLDIINAKHERSVEPGEMVVLTKDGVISEQLAEPDPKLDIFEFVYFSRPDSVLYGLRVNEVRRAFGRTLALEHPGLAENKNALVVPVPDTSIPTAEGFAEALGLTHRQAIVKNRYIGRTFIQPNQKERKQQVRFKHTVIPEAVEGRDLYIIDDSIVRLNTLPRLIKLAKSAGAKSVSVLIGSPPVRFPDFYGIDTPSQTELAAANMTVEQMRRKMKAKYLGFLSLEGMVAATGLDQSLFNLSPFNGVYPIDIGKRKKEIKTPISMEYSA